MSQTSSAGEFSPKGNDLEASESRRQDLMEKRRSLAQEQEELMAKEVIEHDAETLRQAMQIQGKVFEIDQEIYAIASSINNRQLKDIMESRAQFVKLKTSTPSARRSLNFVEDSSAVYQMIEASATLSRNLMRIDQCTPADGGSSISSTVYHRWRNMLLSTVAELNEVEKESFFRKSAGSHLLDVLEMLPETQHAHVDSETPFTDIITRLDNFFKSDGMKRAARLELETMKQDVQKNESNMAFLERTMKAAMNCSFQVAEFDERLMNVVAKNSSDKKIREAANEIDRNGKRYTYTQFRDFILHLELFRDNEKLHKEDKIKSKQLVINEVLATRGGSMNRSSYQPPGARSFDQRDPSRARPVPYSRHQLGQPAKPCYRCGSRSHDPMGCPHRSKICFNCNRLGHMRIMCTVPVSSKRQRSPPQQSFKSEPKKSRVDNVETESEDINQVRSESGSSSGSDY